MTRERMIRRLIERGASIETIAAVRAVYAEESRARPPRRPNSSARVDGKVARHIVQLHEDYPDMTHSLIAAAVNVNQGRVSEVLQAWRSLKM